MPPAAPSPTLASLTYITPSALASTFRATSSLPSTTAVVDVRDADHIGGHIRGSTWVPSAELDYRVQELVRTLKGKDVVVFHCALSQQRGPAAALRYLRERGRWEGREGVKGEEGGGVKGEGEKGKEGDGGEGAGPKEQEVYVLRGGFTEWQEKYGADELLTEGWVRDIWE